MAETIGFVGLGVMGAPMASNLLKAGHELVVFDVVANFEQYVDDIAHVQIADSPGRNQPGTGELNFDYIFERIEASSYDGYVGLEYKAPDGDTESSLAWLPREQRAARAQA